MENMVGEVVRGTLMETDRTVGGRKAVGGKVLSSHAAEHAAKMSFAVRLVKFTLCERPDYFARSLIKTLNYKRNLCLLWLSVDKSLEVFGIR